MSLSARFLEHRGWGTGTWNVDCHFEKLWNEKGIPLHFVSNIDETCSKYDWNDVPGKWNVFWIILVDITRVKKK